MAKASWWSRALAAVNREYERRIRAASLIKAYGAHQHRPAEAGVDEGEVVISNIPRGTRVRRPVVVATGVDAAGSAAAVDAVAGSEGTPPLPPSNSSL